MFPELVSVPSKVISRKWPQRFLGEYPPRGDRMEELLRSSRGCFRCFSYSGWGCGSLALARRGLGAGIRGGAGEGTMGQEGVCGEGPLLFFFQSRDSHQGSSWGFWERLAQKLPLRFSEVAFMRKSPVCMRSGTTC